MANRAENSGADGNGTESVGTAGVQSPQQGGTGVPAPLPRALADVVNQGLSQHGADEEPVTAVSVVQLETRDIEMIEREFGGTRVHAKEVPFDLFAAPSSSPSAISGSAQPGGEAPQAPILKTE